MQYFFVCYQCNGCYETTSEIIQHVELRCSKNVKIACVETIEAEPNSKGSHANKNNCIAIDIVAKKDFVPTTILGAADKNTSVTCSKDPGIIILANELITATTTFIDISDEESTEEIPVAQRIQHPSVSRNSNIIEDIAIVDISDDELITEPSKIPTIDIMDVDTIDEVPIPSQSVCEENAPSNIDIVDISDEETFTLPKPRKALIIDISDEGKSEELPKALCENNNMVSNIT